jgi:hypothetical protein|tara:strand:- start:604 stop:888 length:285 start_codon:yes stop_codon:yes gene_type:complete
MDNYKKFLLDHALPVEDTSKYEEKNPFDEGYNEGTEPFHIITKDDPNAADKVAGILCAAMRMALLMVGKEDALKAFEFAKYSALGEKPPQGGQG